MRFIEFILAKSYGKSFGIAARISPASERQSWIESIPPDKKAPKGTSEIICPFMDLRNNLSSSATASSGVPVKACSLLAPASAACLTDQ